MIKGITEEDKYRVIRPIFGECSYDDNDFPIIKKTSIDSIEWDNLRVLGFKNASPKSNNKNVLLIMFNYDKELIRLWNNPLKNVALFRTFGAIATPDFSLYPDMNTNEIRHNVFMARWLGVTWQKCGCKVLPTVGWALPDTYDICFGGIEYGSIVIISTLGCDNHNDVFLNGFEEMKKRINPPLIVVFGPLIDGMTGTFINFEYEESFSHQFDQISFDLISPIFTIREVL